MITVDHASQVPPFEQIRLSVAGQIHSGQMPPGTRLPTVRQLATDLALAPNTVARAYRELESAGLVITAGRRGTVVAATGSRFTPAMARDVATTLVAALASPEATAAVTSGRLTRALEYAGFGEIDLTEATARPLRLVRSDERPEDRHDRTDDHDESAETDGPADPALTAAQEALHAAMTAATAATARHGVLSAELELAETRVAQLQQELARARAHRDKTADALGEADSAQAAAGREVRRARSALESLRSS